MHKYFTLSSTCALWTLSLITWQLGGELQCAPYVLMSTQEHFPLMWKLFRYYVAGNALECSLYWEEHAPPPPPAFIPIPFCILV